VLIKKKLFPWQSAPGSVPLQNPKLLHRYEPDHSRLFWGSGSGPMDAIRNELLSGGRPIDPVKNINVIDNDMGLHRSGFPHTLHGGKYSYLDNPGGGSSLPKNKGPTAEERAEAWALAMEDAEGFMAPMQGDTIPGVSPGGGSREHQMSVYNTGGYDLTSNRPISDTDAVRKRLYGIMGFA
jgi:hypothetical protein